MKRTKVAQEVRRQEVANGVGQGESLSGLAERLQVHYRTIKREFDLLREKYASADMERYEVQVEVYLEKLDKIEAATVAGLPTKVGQMLINIAQERAKVQGLYAPSKHLTASVTAESSPLFLRFKQAVSGLTEAQIEDAFRYLAALPRTTASPQRDESWFPKTQKVIEGEQ